MKKLYGLLISFTFLFFNQNVWSQEKCDCEAPPTISDGSPGLYNSSASYRNSEGFVIPNDIDEVVLISNFRNNGWTYFNYNIVYGDNKQYEIQVAEHPEAVWTGIGIIEKGYHELGANPPEKSFLLSFPPRTELTGTYLYSPYIKVRIAQGKNSYSLKQEFEQRYIGGCYDGCVPRGIIQAKFDITKVKAPILQHLHYIEGNEKFHEKVRLDKGAGFQIAADGSTSSILRIKVDASDPEMWGYKFRIRGLSNTSDYEFGEPKMIDYETLDIYFKHPEYVDFEGGFKDYVLEMFVNRNFNGEYFEKVILEKNLRVYRTPVLMVHGLWSNSDSFNSLKSELNNSIFKNIPGFLSVHSYAETNNRQFSLNYPYIGPKIDSLVNSMKVAGIAMGKVDYIGHSMGGILGRLHLQSEDYRNQYHKLITVNTPHSGSQVANLIKYPMFFLKLGTCLESVQEMFNNQFCDEGAIDDLRVDSDAIRKLLNGNVRKAPKVPSHTITTRYNQGTNPLPGLVLKLFPIASIYQVFRDPLITVFDGDNDIIVPVLSQRAGLEGNETSLIDNVKHSGSTSEIPVMNKIKNLLIDDPKGENFAHDGFNPATIEPPLGLIKEAVRPTALITDFIEILSPFRGQVLSSVREINIGIRFNNIRKVATIIEYSKDSIFISENTTALSSQTFTIPPNFYGRKSIIVFGETYSGAIVADTSFFYIQETPLPVALFDLKAKSEETKVVVSWSTAWENNSDHFVVERSRDGKTFFKIGKVLASDQSRNISDYHFIDEAPGGWNSYYRIVSVDKDGSYALSRIVSLYGSTITIFYPNPAVNELKIQTPLKYSKVLMRNREGLVVAEKAPGLAKVDLNGIPSGYYIMELIGENNVVLHRQSIVVAK